MKESLISPEDYMDLDPQKELKQVDNTMSLLKNLTNTTI